MVIYKTTCLVNGKIYIGQNKRNITSYLGSGVALLESINKYGKGNFKKEILRKCKNQKELDFFEEYYIKKFDSTNKNIGYNILPGTANKFGTHPMNIPECIEKAVVNRRKTLELKSEEEKQKSYRKQAESVSLTQRNFSKDKKEEIAKKKSISISLAYKNFSKEKRIEISKKMSEAIKGKRLINNGIINKMLPKGESIPEGWEYGKIKIKT